MDEVNGVFLHSRNLDSEFMVKCLQVLVNIFPDIRITTIESDELHFGFKVYFSHPNADLVLLRKHLIVYGEEVRIGPLRTLLTIHGVRLNGGEQYDAELRETICNKFGKLLHVDRVSNSATFLQIILRACVDVPELEDLEIFRNEMFICLPSNSEMLSVTFHCRRCDNDGHGQQNCPQTLDGDTSMTDFSEVSNPPFRRHSFTFSSENRETRSNQDFGSVARNLQGVFSSVSHNTAGPSLGNLDTPLKPPTRSAFFAPTSAAAIGSTQIPPTSTAVEVTNTAGPSSNNSATPLKSPTRSVFFASTSTTADENTKTPPKPTTLFEVTNTPPTPTTAFLDTRILSPRLQRYIDIACEEMNVIDRDQLNAFLHHVKSKSNLVEFARIYTSNVGGLLTLLQRIYTLYYSITEPDTTKEDERFIKKLGELVKRFERNIILLRDAEEMARFESF